MGIARLDAPNGITKLQRYALYYAARDDCPCKLGRLNEARSAYARALVQPLNEAEPNHIEFKRARIGAEFIGGRDF